MAVQIKRLNWAPKTTTWQQAQVWREKRAAMREQFMANSEAASARFGNAQTNQIAGVGDLAARQANARMQAAAQARIDKAIAGLDFSV